MKSATFLALAVCFAMASCANPSRPLATADRVDPARYAGSWYEVGRLPNRFQRDDSRATAEYRLQPDGSLSVLNTEIRPDGSRKEIKGRATVVPGSNGARLRVKFHGLAGLAPTAEEGNYWVIHLERDYSAAVVGTPNRKYLWVLSRESKVPEARRARLLRLAKAQGFDTAKVIAPK